jgi:hypothetical protein
LTDALKALQRGFAQSASKPEAYGGAEAIWNNLSDVSRTKKFSDFVAANEKRQAGYATCVEHDHPLNRNFLFNFRNSQPSQSRPAGIALFDR